MLYKSRDIIHPDTLALLRLLQGDVFLESFFLVGGTSLALQMGHRYSVDLDLFSQQAFSAEQLISHLVSSYSFQLSTIEPNTVLGFIGEVKVDFIAHQYPLVNPVQVEEGLRLVSLEDIGAMKLNAISLSGQRMKDFIDIYYLLEYFSLDALLSAYQIKYPHANPIIPLKSLTFFDEVDPAIDPPIMREKLNWIDIQNRLLDAVKDSGRVFNRSLG